MGHLNDDHMGSEGDPMYVNQPYRDRDAKFYFDEYCKNLKKEEELRKQIKKIQEDNEGYKRKIPDIVFTIHAHKREAELANLKKSLKKIKAKYENLEACLDDMQDRLEEITEERDSLIKKIDLLKK